MKHRIKLIFLTLLFLVGCTQTIEVDLGSSSNKTSIIEVQSIEWDASKYENKEYFEVEKYSQEDKKQYNIPYDGGLFCQVFSFAMPLTIDIKCRVIPNDATYSKLIYYFEGHEYVELIETEDNTVDITFYKAANINLYVNSSDGNDITYIININVIDYSNIEW